MKFILAVGLLAIFQYTSSLPVEEKPCRELFSEKVCTEFEALDNDVADEHDRLKRQLPPPPPPPTGGDYDKDLIEQLLRKKLDFIIRLGLLKHIPFIGQKIHEMVEQDPEGALRTIRGGIQGLIQLGLKLISGGIGKF